MSAPRELVLMPRDNIQRELSLRLTADGELIAASSVRAGYGEYWNAGWAMSRKFSLAYRPCSTQVLELRVGDAAFDVTPGEAVRISQYLRIPFPVLPATVEAIPSPPPCASAVAGAFLAPDSNRAASVAAPAKGDAP